MIIQAKVKIGAIQVSMEITILLDISLHCSAETITYARAQHPQKAQLPSQTTLSVGVSSDFVSELDKSETWIINHTIHTLLSPSYLYSIDPCLNPIAPS